MNDLLKMLAQDPNIAPAFRAVIRPEQELQDTLADVLEYLEQREDITDQTSDDGSPYPNEEMKLATRVRWALQGTRK
jgi:hypothetical protein